MTDSDNGSMQNFVHEGLTALLQHSSRKHKQLKAECESTIALIQKKQQQQQQALPQAVTQAQDAQSFVAALAPEQQDTDADKYFLPFKLACDSGIPKLMAVSLDYIQKLIAYGYLDGNSWADPAVYPLKDAQGHAVPATPAAASTASASKDNSNSNKASSEEKKEQLTQQSNAVVTSSSKTTPQSDKRGLSVSTPANNATVTTTDAAPTANGTSHSASAAASAASLPYRRRLIVVIIETFYECSMFKDAQVQLQVLKCILTTVTSVSCSVHDHALLQAVTSCYQIYLQSSDDIIKLTGRGALTQIFNAVFERMESFASQLKQLEEEQSTSSGAASTTVAASSEESSSISQQQRNSSSAANDRASVSNSGLSSNPISPIAQDVSPSANAASATASATTPATPSVPASDAAAATVNAVVPAAAPNSSNEPPGKRGYCIVCSQPANHYCLQTRDSVCGMTCKLVNLRRKAPNALLASGVKTRMRHKQTVLTNDAYYLLRALIKLSFKSLPVTAQGSSSNAPLTPLEQTAIDSKLLSLELLRSVLSRAGDVFRSAPQFTQLIATDLMQCVLRNSAVSQESIFALSSAIFVQCCIHFRQHLHKVIGPILCSIHLQYVQSSNSTYEHKCVSLGVIKSICSLPELLLELFLNYDCDMSSPNVFAQLCSVVEKMCMTALHSVSNQASGQIDPTWLTETQENTIRLHATECLVAMLSSCEQWIQRGMQIAQQQLQESEQVQALVAGVKQALQTVSEARDKAQVEQQQRASTIVASSSSSATSTLTQSNSGATDMSDETQSAVENAPSPGGTQSRFSSHFHVLRQQKAQHDLAYRKFNDNPKRGLQYMFKHGLLQDTPFAIAAFFHTHPQLDKTAIGDYLGENDPVSKAVLRAYTEQMDFKNLEFDDAIRLFVSGFRLPGEAQKIDRMVEQFASHYHVQNPGRFSASDTAYVLAFSVIMLNTDAHNPGIKNRMTKEEFRKNCRGIDNGKDIDPVFLDEIYDRITQHEIKLKDDAFTAASASASNSATGGAASSTHRLNSDAAGNPKKRITQFMKESQQMVKRTQELIKDKMNETKNSRVKDLDEVQEQDESQQQSAAASSVSGKQQSSSNGGGNGAHAATTTSRSQQSSSKSDSTERQFYLSQSSDWEASLAMFETVWYTSLATLSILIETHCDDASIIQQCLQGYRHAIRICTMQKLDTARVAYLQSLRKFAQQSVGQQQQAAASGVSQQQQQLEATKRLQTTAAIVDLLVELLV